MSSEEMHNFILLLNKVSMHEWRFALITDNTSTFEIGLKIKDRFGAIAIDKDQLEEAYLPLDLVTIPLYKLAEHGEHAISEAPL